MVACLTEEKKMPVVSDRFNRKVKARIETVVMLGLRSFGFPQGFHDNSTLVDKLSEYLSSAASGFGAVTLNHHISG